MVHAGARDERRNLRVGLLALAGALAMLGLGFASVPLYRMFCQVTGFGGTTQRASQDEAARVKAAARMISVRFDGNVDSDLPWHFGPQQTTQDMRIGQKMIAFYKARNLSDKPVTGQASFNVEPELAGIYFKKIACFCFTQQTLKPGEDVDMPVQYMSIRRSSMILKPPESSRLRSAIRSIAARSSLPRGKRPQRHWTRCLRRDKGTLNFSPAMASPGKHLTGT